MQKRKGNKYPEVKESLFAYAHNAAKKKEGKYPSKDVVFNELDNLKGDNRPVIINGDVHINVASTSIPKDVTQKVAINVNFLKILALLLFIIAIILGYDPSKILQVFLD